MKILGILFAVITLMSLLRLIEKRDADRLAAFTGWGNSNIDVFFKCHITYGCMSSCVGLTINLTKMDETIKAQIDFLKNSLEIMNDTNYNSLRKIALDTVDRMEKQLLIQRVTKCKKG